MFWALYITSGIAIVGGVLLVAASLGFALFHRKPLTRLFANRAESVALSVSIAFAAAGFAALFTIPVYHGTTTQGQMSIDTATGITTVETTSKETRKSFVGANGLGLLPLFVAPVVIALLPLLFYRLGVRPAIEGISAILLGGQAAIGMSGYGVFFGPSGVAMVIAGILALRSRNAA